MPEQSTSAPLRVLVVDDCQDAADTMAMLMRLWGHDVRIATDGQAAVDLARSYDPDVVLLDIGLPKLDGYQVARRMRCDLGMHRALLVTVSGYCDPKDAERSRVAGCNDHLVKPVDPDDLQRLLSAWATQAP